MLKVNGNVVFDKKDLDVIVNTTESVGNEKISSELKELDEASIKLVKIGYDFACRMIRSMINACIDENTDKIGNIDAPQAVVETEEIPPSNAVDLTADDSEVLETVDCDACDAMPCDAVEDLNEDCCDEAAEDWNEDPGEECGCDSNECCCKASDEECCGHCESSKVTQFPVSEDEEVPEDAVEAESDPSEEQSFDAD